MPIQIQTPETEIFTLSKNQTKRYFFRGTKPLRTILMQSLRGPCVKQYYAKNTFEYFCFPFSTQQKDAKLNIEKIRTGFDFLFHRRIQIDTEKD